MKYVPNELISMILAVQCTHLIASLAETQFQDTRLEKSKQLHVLVRIKHIDEEVMSQETARLKLPEKFVLSDKQSTCHHIQVCLAQNQLLTK